jgi:hypothetical protein
MSRQAAADIDRLERGYRRVLACYPRSFRADSEDEILAVLLATAAEGQARVGWAEAWDLIRGAVRMRLWPAAARPRAVRAAVKLMLAGAAAELAAAITMLVTMPAVRAAIAAKDAAAVHAFTVNVIMDLAAAPLVIALWLWLAWANGRGEDWARMVSAVCFGLITLKMLSVLAQNGPVLAPAYVGLGAAEWALGLVSVALIFTPQAWRYYRPEPVKQ